MSCQFIGAAHAQTRFPTRAVLTPTPDPSLTPTETPTPTPPPQPRLDITKETEETLGPLEKTLEEQKLGPVLPFNIIKYAIRAAVAAGVPANTIVLLLLMPLIALVIAAARHIVGLRGFGIFLPAALSVVFVAIGPLVGIGLFMFIVAASTVYRMFLRNLKVKLQYLPRMSLMLWVVCIAVLAVLFLAPILQSTDLTSLSIFPVLILVLLAEDFSKVQLGKSAKTAIELATETVILSLVTYILLTLESLQQAALLHPEILLLSVAILNIILGKYVGLRFLEFWRYRRLLIQK